MKKIVRLTEGQLYRLIENAINETDVRTILHAAELADRNYNNAEKAIRNYDWFTRARHPIGKAMDKAYIQRRNFMNAVGKNVSYNSERWDPNELQKVTDNFVDYQRREAFNNPNKISTLRSLYQNNNDNGPSGVIDPKNDMGRIFREYFKRMTYFKNGKWIDSYDDDWDRQEAKEWWAKNGGLENGGLPQTDKVAESVIKKLRRL